MDKQSFNNLVTLDNTHLSIGSKLRTNDYLSQVNSDQDPSFDPTASPESKLNAKNMSMTHSASAGSVEPN